MFRFNKLFDVFDHGFPRIRGDVPKLKPIVSCESVFSPHTRGCSAFACVANQFWVVFPAYAGMFLKSRISSSPGLGFPRIRGDVPGTGAWGTVAGEFSPHTRGCSWVEAQVLLHEVVFPAYAGMFRN